MSPYRRKPGEHQVAKIRKKGHRVLERVQLTLLSTGERMDITWMTISITFILSIVLNKYDANTAKRSTPVGYYSLSSVKHKTSYCECFFLSPQRKSIVTKTVWLPTLCKISYTQTSYSSIAHLI